MSTRAEDCFDKFISHVMLRFVSSARSLGLTLPLSSTCLRSNAAKGSINSSTIR